MKTLLVLAPHPDLVETLRSGLTPEEYRVVHRLNVEEAEPLLAHGLASACVVDVEQTSVQEIWILEKLRRRAPKTPIILYTGTKQPEWEEEAYLHGVEHVLTKPVKIRMLTTLLDRLWAKPLPSPSPLPIAQMLPREVAKPIEPMPTTVTPASYQSLG